MQTSQVAATASTAVADSHTLAMRWSAAWAMLSVLMALLLSLFVIWGVLLLVITSGVAWKVLVTVRQPFEYPDFHWHDVADCMKSLIRGQLYTGIPGIAFIAYAIHAPESAAPYAIRAAGIASAIFVLTLLVSLLAPWELLRDHAVVPYFKKRVDEIDTLYHGRALMRYAKDLSQRAQSLGVEPLYSMGLQYGRETQEVVWYEPARGLKTVRALLNDYQKSPPPGERTAILDDLNSLAHALRRAESQRVQFRLTTQPGVDASSRLEGRPESYS